LYRFAAAEEEMNYVAIDTFGSAAGRLQLLQPGNLCAVRAARRIGCGIVGPSAGDLIAEAALAIEMGADAADIGLTIHPHPTLSETIGMAAEAFEGTITDLYMPKRK
jgi:pyruvate/2-oxoglutarate dehydrogenase complex dihydrolipoamide dehydrogenase (E3) component